MFNVSVIAVNSSGQTTNNLGIVFYNSLPSSPLITSALTATGTVAAAFNYQITATNYPTGFLVIGPRRASRSTRRRAAFTGRLGSRETSP